MNIKCHRRGFTVVEIVLIGFVVSLLAGALVGVRTVSSESSNRVKCASNLRQIGQACLLYANENKGVYPRTRHDPETKKWPAYTNYKSKEPFADDGPEVNDVTAPLYLLMRTQDITSEVFICPSSSATKFDFEEPQKNGLDFSNFPGKQNLSYSYANPYDDKQDNPLTYTLPAEFVIAGDMNPGGNELFKLEVPEANAKVTAGNSLNHNREGGNFLFADGHVEWNNTPLVGVQRDNVYAPGTSEGETVIAMPVNASDTVLLPTAEQDAEAPKKE